VADVAAATTYRRRSKGSNFLFLSAMSRITRSKSSESSVPPVISRKRQAPEVDTPVEKRRSIAPKESRDVQESRLKPTLEPVATYLMGPLEHGGLNLGAVDAQNLVIELDRFLELKNEYGGECQLSPSVMIDAAWHSFLLMPRLYQEYCGANLIDHDPTRGDPEARLRRLRMTRIVYREHFRQEPPEKFWDDSQPDLDAVNF
jgi:hypothetical protein